MGVSMTPFFIIGLPRSRTLWFSELFTFKDTVCIHEHFSGKQHQPLLDGVSGYADTNPLQPADYGNCPVLIIERDINEVIQSIYHAFDKPKTMINYRGAIQQYMAVYHQALNQLTPNNALRINYADINDKLEDIWQFLLPDIPPDKYRIDHYKQRIIKTTNRNIETSLIQSFGSIDAFKQQYDNGLLSVIRITDFLTAKQFVNQLWYEISEDDAEDYLPDVINEYWLGLSDGTHWVGCYRLHQLYNKTWQGHVFMLPHYRKQYTDSGCLSMYHWILDNLDFNKIITQVPHKYKNVIRFLQRSGFTIEGKHTQCFTKDGQLWDMILLGITRDDITEYLHHGNSSGDSRRRIYRR